LWFLDSARLLVCHVLPNGDVIEFPFTPADEPFQIAAGPDGAIWGTFMSGDRLFRLTAAGDYAVLDGPTADAGLASIVTGFDGNPWFMDHHKARIVRGSPSA
jgi:virginiamycin B lyase